jgi:hypothetical protein
MITATELKNIINQVNASFEQDRKRISEMEERIKALEEASAKPAKATKEAK